MLVINQAYNQVCECKSDNSWPCNLKRLHVPLSSEVLALRDENTVFYTAIRLCQKEDPGLVLYTAGVLLPVHPSQGRKPELFTWTWLWPAAAPHSELPLALGRLLKSFGGQDNISSRAL